MPDEFVYVDPDEESGMVLCSNCGTLLRVEEPEEEHSYFIELPESWEYESVH